MKRLFFLTTVITMFYGLLQAQQRDVQQVFFATSEEEMYKLYEQMIDSARISNRFLNPNPRSQHFALNDLKIIERKDTIIKIQQMCKWHPGNKFICERFYYAYISDCMPVAFYERFINYLEGVKKRENYYIRDYSTRPLSAIRHILIKQYESGKLDKEDRLKAWKLIELAAIKIINDQHNFYRVFKGDYYTIIDGEKYMTDNIRKALINAIENPYYPTEYLDFHLSMQDTSFVDDFPKIPDEIKKKKYRELDVNGREIEVLISFRHYEEEGKKHGLSPGQMYLKKISDDFSPEKGYLPINDIAKYAHDNQDKLLIKHLKKFKKKHPDYPLKYF